MSEDDTNPPDEPAAEPPEEEPKPQFGLRGLLVFVFLCGLYFSQFRVIDMFFDMFFRGEDVDATAAATLWLGWFAFGWFYWSRRLHGALVVHFFPYLLVIGVGSLSIEWSSTRLPGFGEIVWGCIAGGAMIGLIANLFSFPAGILMLLVKAFKPTREWRF